VAKSKGWHDEPVSLATHLVNINGEVSECWEAYRCGRLNDPCDKAEKMVAAGIEPLTCLEEELADIVIRALDCAAEFKVDIGKAVAAKSAFNETRSVRHGGKVA
jgi:NTP pyrophosphatase (non-canonical NTP hydrolase)